MGFCLFVCFFGNIFHFDVHYVCMLVQRLESQGRHFTNVHYYYYYQRHTEVVTTCAEYLTVTHPQRRSPGLAARFCSIGGNPFGVTKSHRDVVRSGFIGASG